jgi:hypothetical protein
LKSIIKAKPSNGAAYFRECIPYSKYRILQKYISKGLNASEGAKLNYIGLGQMDLDKMMLQHKQSLLWHQRH